LLIVSSTSQVSGSTCRRWSPYYRTLGSAAIVAIKAVTQVVMELEASMKASAELLERPRADRFIAIGPFLAVPSTADETSS